MRIAIATRAPFVAGAEISGGRLAIGLQNLGHDVLMIVGTDGEAIRRYRSLGIECHYVEQSFTGDGFGLRYRFRRNQLRQLLLSKKIQIVHSNDLPTHQMTSHAGKSIPIPRICHHRWIFKSPKSIDWFNKYGAEHHIFISEATRHQLLSHSKSLPRQPSSVIHNGIPLLKAPSNQEKLQTKQELGLNPDMVTVGFVGQINRHKGVQDLIKAWAHLNKMRSELDTCAELVIVGDDLKNQSHYRKKMEQLAETLSVKARFVGYQDDAKQWFRGFDITIVPSHDEPFGLVTIEAMAERSAVIGSSIGGIQEVIIDRETGLLTPPASPMALANTIKELLIDSDKRMRFADSGRARCESHFSIDIHVNKVNKLYEEILTRQSHKQ